MTKRSYTRHYIAYVGKRIIATGKTPVAALRKAEQTGVASDMLQTAFAAKALVERVEATGRRVRFQIASNGRAILPA